MPDAEGEDTGGGREGAAGAQRLPDPADLPYRRPPEPRIAPRPPLAVISRDLASRVDALAFAPPTAYVYDPLVYARAPHEAYVERYGRAPREILLLGMNPGPFGMAQTGVPFGDVEMVREWLGIEGRVGKPPREHPETPDRGLRLPAARGLGNEALVVREGPLRDARALLRALLRGELVPARVPRGLGRQPHPRQAARRGARGRRGRLRRRAPVGRRGARGRTGRGRRRVRGRAGEDRASPGAPCASTRSPIRAPRARSRTAAGRRRRRRRSRRRGSSSPRSGRRSARAKAAAPLAPVSRAAAAARARSGRSARSSAATRRRPRAPATSSAPSASRGPSPSPPSPSRPRRRR